MAAGSEILPFCHLEDSIIGERCRIGPYARCAPATRSPRGAHRQLRRRSEGEPPRSWIKGDHLTYLGDSEIGARVNVGAGTITCNYDGAAKHRTVIEDDCFIGSDATLVAPVRIARGSYIGAGSTINKDTPADQLTVARARQVSIPAWKPRRKRPDRMCGIVGAVARRDIVPVLIEGLRRLEYRGYDSCGLALVNQSSLDLSSHRVAGRRPRGEGPRKRPARPVSPIRGGRRTERPRPRTPIRSCLAAKSR